MKRNRYRTSALVIVLLVPALLLACNAGGTIKEPAVAGAFYPADKQVLSTMVNDFLSKAAATPVEGRLIALIAPHAGYEYSGQVAAYSYNHLKERTIDTVILIGPSHHFPFLGASVYTQGRMRTPFGVVSINEKMAASLLNEKAGVTFNPAAFEKEHSLEVQLPFLQTSTKDFTIVPILIGQPTRESFDHLSRSLTSILKQHKNAIIIASTDLSHYHDYSTAKAMDSKVIDAVSRMAPGDLEKLLSSGTGEMCGGFPVLLTMMVAQQLGATHGELYNYANSGDVTNDKARVVGYAAMGLYQGKLTSGERTELLALAKKTVASYVNNGSTPEYAGHDPRLMAQGATFVTIKRNNMLRGCIGNIQPNMPLYRSVITNAVSASSRDPRFRAMTREELKDMEIEVTVLSPLEPLQNTGDIRIGTHGILLVKGMNSGVFLPQVPVENNWDLTTYLEQVSLKAGLPKDAWKDAQLYTFTADIIK